MVGTLRASFDSMVPSAAVAENTAVADNSGNTSTVGNRTGGTAAVGNNTADTSAVAGNWSDGESSACTSIAGDTFAIDSVAETGESDNEVVARRDRRLAPLEPMHDEREFPFRESSRSNVRVNCGLYCANWGFIQTFGDSDTRPHDPGTHLRL